jgi:hypothetical protein
MARHEKDFVNQQSVEQFASSEIKMTVVCRPKFK